MASRKKVEGVVKSAAMNKTISVAVERLVKEPKYHKYVRRHSIFKAHDENNDCSIGDVVTIEESRPLSKSKSWALQKIVERAAKV